MKANRNALELLCFALTCLIPSTGVGQFIPVAAHIDARMPDYDIDVTQGTETRCHESSGEPHRQLQLDAYVGATAYAEWTIRCASVTVSYEMFLTVTKLSSDSSPKEVDWRRRISVTYDGGPADLTAYDQTGFTRLPDEGLAFGASFALGDIPNEPGIVFRSFREYQTVSYYP